ncbi:LysE family translocator [Candidatus Leptofilum sp.]|uniref:LysE family translocator n=1 Tax=Candidatus Leptofilum sp. TaxID=3241576 RepID=UPI003B59E0DC
MIGYLLQGLGYGGVAAAQPGPFQAYLLSQTLKNGLRSTLVAALAPLISDGPIIALVLLVLTQVPIWFVAILRFGGSLFLIYLARKAYQSAKMMDNELPQPTIEKRQSIREAALMNMLSPNAYIYWSTVTGPVFLDGWHLSPAIGIGFMVAFYVALIGGFMGFVVLFGIMGRAEPRLNKTLGYVSAIALVGFAIYQVWDGVQDLIA